MWWCYVLAVILHFLFRQATGCQVARILPSPIPSLISFSFWGPYNGQTSDNMMATELKRRNTRRRAAAELESYELLGSRQLTAKGLETNRNFRVLTAVPQN